MKLLALGDDKSGRDPGLNGRISQGHVQMLGNRGAQDPQQRDVNRADRKQVNEVHGSGSPRLQFLLSAGARLQP